MNSFKKLGLHPSLLKIADERNFEQPTSIQKQAIPIIENKKKCYCYCFNRFG